MAITVDLSNLIELYDAESTTSWTTDDGVTAYTGWQREGTNCIGMQGSQGTVYAYKTITSVNLTATHVRSWMQMIGTPDTKTNGGFCIILGDGTNTIAYNVGGSDDLGFTIGAWSNFVLDTANLPSNFTVISGTESSLNLTAITQVGGQFDIVNKAVGTVDNCFLDICRYGSGLIIKGGGSSTQGTFAEIAADDLSTAAGKAYGIIRELQTGVYGVQGDLIFGDAGSADSYFEDTNAIVVFEDREVASDLYKISIVGNATGTNSFVLGELSGSSGIKGCIILSAGADKVALDMDNANVDVIKLYGCSFLDVGTTAFPTVDANKEALNCTFDSSGIVTPSTMKMENCSFISADTDGITLSITTMAVKDCVFIDPTNHAIEITAIGTYSFDNLVFSGTDGISNYDIENTTAGLVTINASNGSNPVHVNNSGGGSTTINNNIILTIEIKDADGVTITETCEVTVVKDSDTTILYHAEDVTTGSTAYSFDGGISGTDIYINILNVGTYEPTTVAGITLPITSSTITIQLPDDRFYSNP